MGSITVACYKPRPGCEQALLELVRNHLPPLRPKASLRSVLRSSCARQTEPLWRFSSGSLEKRSPALIAIRLSSTCGRNSRRHAGMRRLQICLSFRICLGILNPSDQAAGPPGAAGLSVLGRRNRPAKYQRVRLWGPNARGSKPSSEVSSLPEPSHTEMTSASGPNSLRT